jgi:hypothetical protein
MPGWARASYDFGDSFAQANEQWLDLQLRRVASGVPTSAIVAQILGESD